MQIPRKKQAGYFFKQYFCVPIQFCKFVIQEQQRYNFCTLRSVQDNLKHFLNDNLTYFS